MKKYLVFVSYILIFCNLLIPTAYANEGSVSVSYNPLSGLVTVKGEATGHTSIRTSKYDYDMSAASSGNMFTDYEQIYADGAYTYDFYMPYTAPYGKYTVWTNDGSVCSDSFIYYDTSAADMLIPELNKKTSGAALASAISSDAAILGIDVSEPLYLSNSSEAADILVSGLMPFVNSGHFYTQYYGALAMAEMKGSGASVVKKLLSDYEENLGIDYNAFSLLDDNHKNDICTVLSSLDFESEFKSLKQSGEAISFNNILSRTTALSAVRTSQSWLEIRDAFTSDYSAVLGKIISANLDYKSSMESDVFTRMAKYGDFSSYNLMKKSFNDAVAYIKSQNGKNVTANPPAGVGSSPSVSMPSTNVVPSNEYDSEISGDVSVVTSFSEPLLSGDTAQYIDVYESSWEYNAVSSLGGSGVISGYTDGSFRPGNLITRAEFTKLIVSAYSIKSSPAEFSDVSASDWFYPYVTIAAGANIINGYDGKFNPDGHILRQDAAVILYRLSELLGRNYYGSVNFADFDEVSLYAMTAVRGLGSVGIINGDFNMYFYPTGNLTRAEAAQLIYNFIVKRPE